MKSIKIYSVVLAISVSILLGCVSNLTPIPISEETNVSLTKLLENFDYSNSSTSPYSFHEIVNELERRGDSASETAPTLAKAMAYNRRDSVVASEAIIAMGPSAKSAIPYLLQNLDNSREEVRRYSIFALGIIGESASCAVPQMASLLWDKESYVRSTSAGALTEIINMELVEYDYLKLDPTVPGSVNADEPEGSISGIARQWWLETGQSMNWPTENCEVSK